MHTLSEKKMIAITGSMGSGKSEVSKYVLQLYPVIDCDKINAHLLEKGEKGYHKLIQLDWVVLDENGQIDKKEMARCMFSDAEKRKEAESILHPLIFEEINIWKEKQNASYLFVEVPLLFEIQAQSYFDEIWCVYCDLDTAIQRLIEYRHFTYDQAMARIKKQLSVDYKKKNSDILIENNGNKEQLYHQIDIILGRR